MERHANSALTTEVNPIKAGCPVRRCPVVMDRADDLVRVSIVPTGVSKMYRLEINGAYRGHFDSPGEAMAEVDKWARPYGYKWKVTDGFGRVYAEG